MDTHRFELRAILTAPSLPARPVRVARAVARHLEVRRRTVAARGAVSGLARQGAGLGWILAAIPVIVAGLVVLVVGGHGGSWLGGVVAAGAVGFVAGPARTRLLGQRRLASSPERRTEQILEPLASAGWRFAGAVPGPDGPLHHVVAGPGGVIVLESLAPRGVVKMRGGDPILERTEGRDATPTLQRIRPRALPDAGAVRENVRRLTGRRIWVQAAVVFWTDFPQGCVVDGRCVFIHGSRLSEWLTRRPHQLDDAQVEAVLADIELLQTAPGDLSLPVAV